MKPRTLLLAAVLCFALAVLVLVIAGLALRARTFPLLRTLGGRAGEEWHRGGGKAPAGGSMQSYQSNGERIYFTGADDAGERSIAFIRMLE